jgi:predicted DNA-binding ribbon-helix-helix protein
MCKLFIDANPELWSSQTRSVRVDGVVTSIRLELYFWQVLDEIASRDKLTLPGMISKLYGEAIQASHDIGNFTSFLRVCAIRYLGLQISGDVPPAKNISIASLDADTILDNESHRYVLAGWTLLHNSEAVPKHSDKEIVNWLYSDS